MAHKADRADFVRAILDSALNPEDFLLIESRDDASGNSAYPGPGAVIVRRISTNVEKIYETDSGRMWAIEFSDDLNTGLFL
jgi:hypothetical protein